jgi:hypothetical protein
MNLPAIKINLFSITKLILKMFKKKQSIPTLGKRYLLTVAINDYKGEQNDLRGCLNDQNAILKLFKGYIPTILRDSSATLSDIKKKLQTIINIAKPGDYVVFHYSGHGTQVIDRSGDEMDGYDEAICLYDGTLIDDEIGAILENALSGVHVLMLSDSCFSGSITRSDNIKDRFINRLNTENMHRKKTRFKAENMKTIVISGCRENQTSKDAYIAGDFHGAFTYYLCQSARPGQTVRQWFGKLNKTKIKQFQNPTLEGSNFDVIFI